MSHRFGDPFDIPPDHADQDDAEPQAPVTIAERVQAGLEAGNHHDGRIVPFPAGLRGDAILRALRGDELRTLNGFIAHGYRATVYDGFKDEQGRVLQAVIRFDHPNERKVPLPLRYCGKLPSGENLFWFTWIPGTKPLYGLDQLAQYPDKPVLAVEGEKACEAARKRFPHHVCITWASGTPGVRRAEMIALSGRSLIVWPDNDPPGRKAARLFAARALKAGATEAAVVDLPPGVFDEGWDLADDLPGGLDPEFAPERLVSTARPMDQQTAAKLLRDPARKATHRRLLGHKPGYSKVQQEHVADAVSMLDPDMPGNEWRNIARCIFHALGVEGLPLFNSWSQKGTKYKNGEPAQLWTAYSNEEGFSGPPLTWLFNKAKKHAEDRRLNFSIDPESYAQAAIEGVNENHAVVVRGSKTVIMQEKYDPRFQSFSVEFLKRSDFIDQIIWPIPTDGGKTLPLGKYWFGSTRRQQFDRIYFAPNEDVGRGNLNMWRGFAVEPAYDPEAWSKLKHHLLNHVAQGDQAAFDYIMDWLAFAVQRLDWPVGTALVLRGPKGAGKSIIIEILGHIFGRRHTFVTAISDDIIGKFNGHLETTLLLGVEEAFAPQNRSADGTLKDMITRKHLRLEDKFFSVWSAPSHLRIIMTSNNDQVVRADPGDRRYAVFQVTNPHQNDPDARRRYFGALMEQMETGGYAAMLGELLARDISAWNNEAIPQTEALKEQVLLNLPNDPVTAWYHSRLEDGIDILSGEAVAHDYRWSLSETVWVPVSDVVADYSAFAKRHGHRGNDQRLKSKLEKFMPFGFRSEPRRVPEVDRTRLVRMYPFPPLEQARQLFAATSGFKVE